MHHARCLYLLADGARALGASLAAAGDFITFSEIDARERLPKWFDHAILN